MANLGATFDATVVEPTATFEPLPAGRYVVQIVASEMRPTRDGSGQYLWIEMDVLEGEHQGRKLWDRLNLVNPNAQAVEIAQRTLSAICHAAGRLQLQDSEELHLIPMLVDVKVQPPRNGYDASNKVRYLPLEQAPAPAAPVRQAPQPPARPATPPWKKA